MDRVTIYFRGGLGAISRVECRTAEVRVRGWAQYPAAVECRFVPKGARKERGFVQSYRPSLLVLDGWGHPEPDGMFDESQAEVRQTRAGTVTSVMARYSACSDGWQRDFDAMVADYLERSGARVLADFRGHDPMREAVA